MRLLNGAVSSAVTGCCYGLSNTMAATDLNILCIKPPVSLPSLAKDDAALTDAVCATLAADPGALPGNGDPPFPAALFPAALGPPEGPGLPGP